MRLSYKTFLSFIITLFIVSCTYEGVGNDSSSPGGVGGEIDDVKSINLSISSENIEVNSEITFTILSDKNDLLTSSCKFFVNGTEISGNKFKPGEAGDYTVYATYKALTSSTKTFAASAQPIKNFKTNVLIEDFTGAWCGYCTRVAYKLGELKKLTSQVVVVAAHYGDALQYTKITEMTNAFGVSSYPHARLNRTAKWNESQSAVTSLYANSSKVGVLIESSLSGSTLSIKIKAKFAETFTDLKFGVFLLENDLLLDQRNYGDFGYGSDDPIVNFEHDDVLRVSLTSPLGDNIPSTSTKAGAIFEKSFTFEIPETYKKDKMDIVAFITDKDKKSLNARHSEIGKTQTFEEL